MIIQEKDEKSFPTLQNLIQTGENKYSPTGIKTTWQCYSNPFDPNVNIQSQVYATWKREVEAKSNDFYNGN